ncbi:PAB-dependent poly(A)-specific ribonuclease subunit PAN2 [Amylocarpus encephaloides]|uniref:PAN2-PAN3 deadenylation complex catalytic subunit PAN2 n=1 Tax=Amylocarpus encephaloides TaxID=45428 RepID=A0A9P7YNW7_9HELO|nr:PAB-dependent poly(A)-specific ribonuclease subunit PAN2 [Amylocarpus encephaloides]
MDGDWEEVGRLLLPPPGPNAIVTKVATLAFDTAQELLWAGNEFGRVSSFYSTELARYTSFKASDKAVQQLLFHDKGVIALCSGSVHMATRRGPPLWHIRHDDMKELRCMSFTSKGTSEILVAGEQHQMFVIDVEKGVVAKQIPTSDQYTKMKRSRYICAATGKGTINILDPVNLALLKTWNAHASLINDMDAQHDFIVTCGYSLRQQQSYMLDPLVNVFDLKNMKPMSPIPFPAGAAYVRMHPRMSTTCIVVSQHGQIHLVDLMNVNTSNIRQANVVSGYLSMVEIAPSGEAIVMADSEFNIHLWGSPSRVRFAELSNPVEFADPEETPQPLDWNVDTPLNSIGMPYYREQLLSAWPSHMIFEIGAPPQKIDPHLLSTLKVENWGAYSQNTRKVKRNQVANTRTAEKTASTLQAPKFLSEKARESANEATSEHPISDVADAVGATELSSMKAEVPMMYRNVEIKYSKFGVDDFDFGHYLLPQSQHLKLTMFSFYNKTAFSGLEIHISNSYANPLLQIMHFTPLVRNAALAHTATACPNELCLLCELGFLFDMLEKAEGSICQATNLLKTFSNHIQARELRLLEEDAPGSSLTSMLQGLNRFLLESIVNDYKKEPPHVPALDHILATAALTAIQCTHCGSEHTLPGTTVVTDLIYPLQKLSPRNPRPQKASFCQILKSSVEKETITRGYCTRCTRYQSLSRRNTIHNAPAVLMLNASITSQEAKQLWARPKWLPEEIGVIIDQGQFFCYQGEDLKFQLHRGMHNVSVYSLIGIAADIDSGQHQKSHLVSLVNVAHSRPEAPGESQWHLFNDFLVRPIRTEDALTFNTSWKLPSVITYQLKRGNNHIDDSWKQNLDTSLLYRDQNKIPGPRTYRPLVHTEAPGGGTIVALDTEFVAVRQPEIEMNSDGERETIRPIVYALARVSVIRGSGEDEGLPFINDYIKSKEPIVDYLTSYSGIIHGDLDPRLSKHNLVSLKVAYKKLWILLNLGCKFLGHGLKQDFRVANIHVPKSQVIDTIDFFFVKARLRKLSLAFLAWFLLKEDIQLETHDSIEDARTALKLYRKYEEFQDAGILETILADIYRTGRDMNYKPPLAKKDGHVIERTETPPIAPDGHLNAGAPPSGPTTPVRRPAGLAPGSGGNFGSGWTPGKGALGGGLGGSPLR